MKKQNWIEITAIQLGGAICLPVILVGFQLGRDLGIGMGLGCLFVANLFLFLLSLVGAHLASSGERSTLETVELFFGKKGKSFFALLMIGSLLVWFAIQAQMASSDLYLVVQQLGIGANRELLCFGVTLLMVIIPLFGFEAIAKVADFTVPFMLAAICFSALFHMVQGQTMEVCPSAALTTMNFCLVVAANICAVCDMPTFFRHAKNLVHAQKAAVATFLIGIPAVEAIGLCIGSFSQGKGFLEALCPSGDSVFRACFALFIFLAAFTNNNGNFYSAKVSLDGFEGLNPKARKPILATLALLCSSAPIFEHFTSVVCFFGLFWVSMGVVILSAYLMERYRGKSQAAKVHCWIAFLAGLFCGLICSFFREEMAMMCGLFVTTVLFFVLEKIAAVKEVQNVDLTI